MESPLQAEQLLAADGCRGERVSFPQECGSWVTVQDPANGPTPSMSMLSWEGKAVEV